MTSRASSTGGVGNVHGHWRPRVLYERFVRQLEDHLKRPVATGQFGAMMEVDLINDGPVTITMDTRNKE